MLTADALNRISRGDRAAFTHFYTQAQPNLTRYAAGILAGDLDAALDVVDEAFLSVWREAGRYSGVGSADGWIRRLVRNKAIDWLRRRRERPLGAGDALGSATWLVDDAESPEAAAQRSSAARRLREALEQLSPDHREVVWLCYFEERSLAEIALIADCPENTVKTRLFHARRLLRLELELMEAI